MGTQASQGRHLRKAEDGHLISDADDTTLDELVPCELCQELIDYDVMMCPYCKAGRQPCPCCGIPFWHGADICPHCYTHKPNPKSWSLM